METTSPGTAGSHSDDGWGTIMTWEKLNNFNFSHSLQHRAGTPTVKFYMEKGFPAAAAGKPLSCFVNLDQSQNISCQPHSEHCEKEFRQSKMATANKDDAANLERKYVDLKKKNSWKEIGIELGIDWEEAQTIK